MPALPPTTPRKQAFPDRRFGPRLCKKARISIACRPHGRELAWLNTFFLEAVFGRA